MTITKKGNIPSPFEVIDLTLVKKVESVPVTVPVSSIKDPIVPKIKEVEKPISFFPNTNLPLQNWRWHFRYAVQQAFYPQARLFPPPVGQHL